MKNFTKTIIALATMCMLAPSYATHSNNNSGSFWEDKAEGWYWYTKQPEVVKKKPKKKEEPKVVITETKEPEKKEGKTQAPEVFSADWVKKNLEVYKKLAWDNPTVENMRAYLYLQRFALDRSEQFAYAGQLALQGDPFLDEVARHPMGGSANKDVTNLISGEHTYVLKKLFKKVGLFFVFKNDCYLCDKQAELLNVAKNKFGISIQAVSLDMPNERCRAAQYFPDYIINPDIVAQQKIKALPSTFFFNGETNDIKPLLQGFVTYADLTRRTISAATKYHWLSTEDLNLIKPVDDITSLSSVLTAKSDLAKRITSQKEGINPYGEDTNFIKPELLVKEIIKEKEKHTDSDFVPRGF